MFKPKFEKRVATLRQIRKYGRFLL